MNIVIVSQENQEPLTLEECRQHLRIDDVDSDGHPDDNLIMAYLAAAREYCENFTGLSFIEKTIVAVIDEFPFRGCLSLPIDLPSGPVSEIVSFTYGVDSDQSVNYIFSPYTSTVYSVGGWPSVALDGTEQIVITYNTSGFNQSDSFGVFPASIKAAILLQLGNLYENREATAEKPMQRIALGVESLLRPYRINKGMA